MRAEVTRRVRFEAAHHLPDHKGQCQYVHGHSWVAWIVCAGEIRSDGMVVDMGHVAAHFADEIEPQLDHAVLNGVDHLRPGARFHPPSTENVARYLLDAYLKAGFPVVRVTVQETENQTATVFA